MMHDMRRIMTLVEAVWHRNLSGKWIGEKPREFWRGTSSDPAETRRIRTGNSAWDSYLFVSSDQRQARAYGAQLEKIVAKPDANILYQGTRAFRRLAAGLRGSLLDVSSGVAERAKHAGYDAVWFEQQGNVGTVIFNLDKFERNAD